MLMDKENMETLNVEIERDGKKVNVARNSARQLHVQVKRRRVKRQYRRNQDAINFLRRFTLAVVVIDLGGGNSMCEQYMERVTGYMTPSSPPMNHHRHSSTSSSSENHFPTVPSRPPLTPLESRKLFLAYNQSLYDAPVRFNIAKRIDKESKLSKLYSRLIHLLYENNRTLNDNRSLSEWLKNGNSFNAIALTINNFTESYTKSQNIQTLITKQLKQSIEVISSHAPFLPLPMRKGDYLLFRLCSKTLEKLRAAQRMKQRRSRDDNKPSFTPTDDSSLPLRKNLIQATEFIRHRWKRDTYIPVAPSDPSNSDNTSENIRDSQVHYNEKKGVTEIPGSTGSYMSGEEDRGVTSNDNDGQQKSEQLVSDPPKTKLPRGSGFRLIKSYSSNNKNQTARDLEVQEQVMNDGNFNDATKQAVSRHDTPYFIGHSRNDAILPILNQSREYCKRDVPMIFTIAETNLNDLMVNKSGDVTSKTEGRKQNNGNSQSDGAKTLGELSLGLDKNPRYILSLMEAGLFNNWQRFSEVSKRLSVFYRVDSNDTPKNDKDESLIWLSVRQKIMESLLLNMDANVFATETFKKAEQRKRAMEQIYHDYSFSILGELKNVKEMPISRTFQSIYWVIKIYVIVWQLTICLVLFFGSVFEDKTALNIWGIFNILTSLLHFMVDDWINTSFQPEKTSACIWFGVVYGVYKPITILLVATLSSEIYKQDGGKKKGLIARVCEIIRGRKRPPLIADKCLKKLKGLFITPETSAEKANGSDGKNQNSRAATSGEKGNGNLVYKGIKAVKIRAKIKRMEMDNGNLIVITQTAVASSGAKQELCCVICGTSTTNVMACAENGNDNHDEEKVHEGHLFCPSAPMDNEAGMTAEDLYPEETDDEEEDEDELEEVVDEDELEEVVDEDDDESDEEDHEDNEECSHPDHPECTMREHHGSCSALVLRDGDYTAMPKVQVPADVMILSETRKPGDGGKSTRPGVSLISCAGNGIQGNLINDSNGQGEDLLHGPIVDGGNLHI